MFYSIFKKTAANESDMRDFGYMYDAPPDDAMEHKDLGIEEDDDKSVRSVEEAYPDASLIGKIVVRDEELARFYVFDDSRELYEMLNGSRLLSLHEVVLANHRQKLRFDFDFNKEAFDELCNATRGGDNYHPLMSELLQTPEVVLANPLIGDAVKADYRAYMNRAAASGFDYMLTKNQMMVVGDLMIRDFIRFLTGQVNAYVLRCESYTVESNKFSVHLIVGAYTRTFHEMAEYANWLYRRYREQSSMADLCARFMDMAVYKSLQNFRLCLAVKRGAGEDRRKMLRNRVIEADTFANWQHTLLTRIDYLDVDISEDAKAIMTLNKELPESDLKGLTERSINLLPDGFARIIEPYSEGLRVAGYHGNLVTFRRMHGAFCRLCLRNHDTDNSLMVLIFENSYVVKCRRNRAGRKVVIPVRSKIERREIHAEMVTRAAAVGEMVDDTPVDEINYKEMGDAVVVASPGTSQRPNKKRMTRVDVVV